ncbi:hypothetical protein QJQ45_004419 [Haematococcus lacustris]|nr:hypothetical protein QJQ45_004419 [Haematococcus lacustris]
MGQCRAIFVEDLMQEVALTANKDAAIYTGPSPFSALDFPELTACADVGGPNSCLVYNGSGHLALQPHGNGSVPGQADEADSNSENEEEVGSRQAAADTETKFVDELGSELNAIPPRGRQAAPVPASDFQQHVNGAKQELAATADAVVRDHSCFLPPEHARLLCTPITGTSSLAMKTSLSARPVSRPGTTGQRAPALLDQHKLSAQQPAFVEVMRCQAEHRVQLGSTAANPAEETTKLWRYLGGQPITKADISKYIKLAELALVMTPGSVEEKCMFSTMAYLKDDTRNRLQKCHLRPCLQQQAG